MNIGEHQVKDALVITNPQTTSKITINPEMTHDVNVALHKVLYRSSAYEAMQAFKQLNSGLSRFWSSVPSNKRQVRRIRSDLYQRVIDKYSDILITGLNKPIFKNPQDELLFDEIFVDKNNLNFWKLAKKALDATLITGDSDFKATVDTELSEYPIIEIYDAENIEYGYKRGFLTNHTFYTFFKEKETDYELREIYKNNKIEYELYKDGKPVNLSETEYTKNLTNYEFEGDFNMALQFKIWDSPSFAGRGKPLFDGKIDLVDALDEILSQWLEAIRAGRISRFIPKPLIPKDENGNLLLPNPFDNDFISTEGSLAEGGDKIETVQPSIQYDAFLQSYVAILDCFLMGLMSPSTLGIDARKLDDNATAQREREKVTAWVRSQIADAFSDVLVDLINLVFKTYAVMNKQTPHDIEVEITFDEYNSPNIEEKLEIAAKGAPGLQTLTYEQIAAIIADDKDEQEQLKIAEELKALNNPTIEEPSMFPTDADKLEDFETEEAQEEITE